MIFRSRRRSVPIELKAKGAKIPGWTIDQYGLCSEVPGSPVTASEAVQEITLISDGGSTIENLGVSRHHEVIEERLAFLLRLCVLFTLHNPYFCSCDLSFFFSSCCSLSVGRAQTRYDILLRNGIIYDGTGSKSYTGDVGINADTIAAIGDPV